jgi:hypothetical protein
MHSEKALMDVAADKLIKRAADCFDLAETQHHVADEQHKSASRQHCSADELATSADKLEALGHKLEADAVEIKGNAELVAPGIRHSSTPRLLPVVSGSTAPAAGSAWRPRSP